MARKSEDDDGKPNLRRPLPKEPTEALPGTLEKLDVMRERLKKGVWLFHPNDAKVDED